MYIINYYYSLIIIYNNNNNLFQPQIQSGSTLIYSHKPNAFCFLTLAGGHQIFGGPVAPRPSSSTAPAPTVYRLTVTVLPSEKVGVGTSSTVNPAGSCPPYIHSCIILNSLDKATNNDLTLGSGTV